MLRRLFLILLIVQLSLAPAMTAAYGSPSPPNTPSKTAAAAKGVIECSADVNWGSCLGMAAGFIPVAGDAAKIILKKGDETVEATFDTTTKKFDDVKNVSATNRIPAAVQPVVGDPKLQNLMDNIYKGTSNPNRVGDGTLADAVRYENATGGTVGGRTHTVKAQETIRGLQNWLDRNPHALQADRQEAITQIQNLQDALGS